MLTNIATSLQCNTHLPLTQVVVTALYLDPLSPSQKPPCILIKYYSSSNMADLVKLSAPVCEDKFIIWICARMACFFFTRVKEYI